MKLVNENLKDILQPKNFNGKIFFYESSVSGLPIYIFKITDINFEEDLVSCIVLHNDIMVHGGQMDELELEKGKTFNFTVSKLETFLSWNQLKELTKVPDKLEQDLYDLNELKKLIEGLI